MLTGAPSDADQDYLAGLPDAARPLLPPAPRVVRVAAAEWPIDTPARLPPWDFIRQGLDLVVPALAASMDFDAELPAEHPVRAYLSLEFFT